VNDDPVDHLKVFLNSGDVRINRIVGDNDIRDNNDNNYNNNTSNRYGYFLKESLYVIGCTRYKHFRLVCKIDESIKQCMLNCTCNTIIGDNDNNNESGGKVIMINSYGDKIRTVGGMSSILC